MPNYSPILEKILADTYTLSDLHRRVRTLKTYLLQKLFQSDNKELDEAVQAEVNWLYSLGEDFYKQFTVQNVYQLFDQLEKDIKALTPLIMYFPFEPTKAQITQFGGALRKDYGENFIFDIKYDPQLIGGCAIVWKGIYKDYPLRANIQNNSQKLLENFKQAIASHI